MPERFTRDCGSTEAEWLRLLPAAAGAHALALQPGAATVAIGAGRLALRWQPLPPRRIALLALPRLEVHFEFSGLDAEARAAFLRHFDLTMQRGGG